MEEVKQSSKELLIPESFYCPLTKKIFKDPVVFPDGNSYERSAVEGNHPIEIYYPNRALKIIIHESIVYSEEDQQNSEISFLNSMRKRCIIGDSADSAPQVVTGNRKGHVDEKNCNRCDCGMEKVDYSKNAKSVDEKRTEGTIQTHESVDLSSSCFDNEKIVDKDKEDDCERGTDTFCDNVKQFYRPPEHFPDDFFCPITSDLIIDPVIDPDGISYDRESLLKWLQRVGTSPITRTPLSKADLVPNNAISNYLKMEMSRSEDALHPMIQQWMEDEKRFQRMDWWRRQIEIIRYYWGDPYLIGIFFVVVFILLVTTALC